MEMTHELCDARTESILREQEHTRERLDKHSETIDQLRELGVKLTAVTAQLSQLSQAHEARLTALEKRPGRWLDKVLSAIISAVVAAVITYII